MVVDLLLLCNAILLGDEEKDILAGRPAPELEESSDGLTTFNVIEILFCTAFTVEMILKLIGLGFVEYARSPSNLFDGGVTLTSIAGIFYVYLSARLHVAWHSRASTPTAGSLPRPSFQLRLRHF